MAIPSDKRTDKAGEEIGVLDHRLLPSDEFLALWDAILVDGEVKDRVLAHAILNFIIRPVVDRSRLPLHGLILLVGPPGTGKTSLARGLAAKTAVELSEMGQFNYIEVDPHQLTSSALGHSQKAVVELLSTTIAGHAAQRPTIVLLDEVETLAAARSSVSLTMNPIDVHRATDALLAQLDVLANNIPHLLFLATSNFPEAIDTAFISRADYFATIDRPSAEGCREILRDTVMALAKHYPQMAGFVDTHEFEQTAFICKDLDGRQIRKLVLAACTIRRETAHDPGKLQPIDLLRAFQRGNRELKKLDEQLQRGA